MEYELIVSGNFLGSGCVAGAARVVLIALVVVLMVGLSYAVRSDFRELPKYSHFICHHKVGAATQFRLVAPDAP